MGHWFSREVDCACVDRTDSDQVGNEVLTLLQSLITGDISGTLAAGSDAIFDTVCSYTGNHDFATSFGEAQDLNANGMGNDELIQTRVTTVLAQMSQRR
jgi:hypothetical protein